MSMQDAAAIAGAGQSTAALGPLEAVHLRSRNYRDAADKTRITATHWHIAWPKTGLAGASTAWTGPFWPLLLHY